MRIGLQFVDLTRGAQRTTESAIITQTIIDQVLIRVGGRRTEGGSELGNGFLRSQTKVSGVYSEPKLALKGLSLAAFSTYLRDALAG